jgi:hypothetical protein
MLRKVDMLVENDVSGRNNVVAAPLVPQRGQDMVMRCDTLGVL